MQKPLDIAWLQDKVRQFKSEGRELAAKVVADLIHSNIRSVSNK